MEDEEVLAELLQRKLIERGYEVTVAPNGVRGMDNLRETKPDLVLLDIIMPEKGGFEVMEEMNKSEETNMQKVPVIIISNSGQPVEIDRALAMGVRDYLIKAKFDPAEVIEKVDKQFGIDSAQNVKS